MKRLFGLIGYPLGHSFSKAYFAEKFAREGITDAVYENFPLEDITTFPSLKKEHPGLNGLNVTIPHKEAVIRYLDVLSEDAREVGAVNTICFCTKTGHLVKVGHNTDVTGFRTALEQETDHVPTQALVLGTGGSSKAVIHVLGKIGTRVVSVSRHPGKSSIGYKDIDRELMDSSLLIVNTTPLGMHPDTGSFPGIPYEYLTDKHLLFDLVYNPETTEFMKKGRAQGARAVNGHEMLVQQAEAAWQIWNR